MNSRRPLTPVVFLAMLLSMALANANEPQPDPRDPFEPLNRSVYRFNEGLDRALLKPVAVTYSNHMPIPVQRGVSNFFVNAKYPVTLVNNLLQGKIAHAASDLGRLLINSTLGLGGLLDPATPLGLERNDEDFGQTLGKWGVPPGPYIMMPLLGPYTLRDGLGSFVDDFAEPRGYIKPSSTRWSFWVTDKFDRRVRLLDTDSLIERTGDGYAFVRSAYLQRREYLVLDGEVPVEDLDDYAADENEISDP